MDILPQCPLPRGEAQTFLKRDLEAKILSHAAEKKRLLLVCASSAEHTQLWHLGDGDTQGCTHR